MRDTLKQLSGSDGGESWVALDKLYTAGQKPKDVIKKYSVQERLDAYNEIMSGHLHMEIMWLITCINNGEVNPKIDRAKIEQNMEVFNMLNDIDWEDE